MNLDFIITPFVNILLYIYDFLGHGVNDFGWAIIIFTILIRLLLFPLTKSQLETSKNMQKLNDNPEYQKLQKKRKDGKIDQEEFAQKQMALYQELGINPLGSCLPTLLQFPIIIGLYWAVTKALATSPIQLINLIPDINLGNASTLLPLNSHFLWMDLSQPERWYGLAHIVPQSWGWGEFGVPIMAIVVFITSFFQSKMTTPTSSNPNDQSAQMGKMMTLYIPVLMAWLSYSYSAGLALYFAAGNLVTLLQYGLMGRLDFSNILPNKNKKTE
ncbi:MAG: YidC/Oxa1 family membrane protein insertase [Anaerolineales bacterium]|jgi:YidC/Oxa1 family membrane protein insertase